MKPNDIGRRLLPYIGIYVLDPTFNANDAQKRQLIQSDVEFLAGCITGGIAEAYADGPAALSERRFGEVLRAPQSFVVGLTKYSKAITGFSGYQSWMQFCTCRMGGDDQDNEIVNGTTLLNPYMGETNGAVNLQIWGDTVPLPQGTDSVLSPVELPRTVPLMPATSREEFRAWNLPHDYGNPPQRPGSTYFIQQNKTQGQPAVYFCEAHNDPALNLGYIPLYLHVNPMPMMDYRIQMRLKAEPPTYTYEQILNLVNPEEIPDFVFPMNWQESVMLPYIAQRFTAHSSFTNKQAKEEISRQYQAARVKLLSWTPTGSASIGQFK